MLILISRLKIVARIVYQITKPRLTSRFCTRGEEWLSHSDKVEDLSLDTEKSESAAITYYQVIGSTFYYCLS